MKIRARALRNISELEEHIVTRAKERRFMKERAVAVGNAKH